MAASFASILAFVIMADYLNTVSLLKCKQSNALIEKILWAVI